ncbi:choice-of-anchor R domain-containing protein [Candidatus Poriferisodalis sp.]|uniref:choice-of-anchor R domain-containing protein n=1 Tax=Candidatus Poriferisodalis sp. TaxID=3101277 RepID=UPI003B51E6E8
MVQNLGQANDGYRTVGSGTVKALTQGFTTGSVVGGYELQGIGVNIEGSGSNFPDGPTSVSVAVHADSGGKPGAKLFDLVSPSEFAVGHSFFEAPRGATLEPSTSYVLVWRYLGGTVHRLRKTGSNGEDSGALTGFSLANAFYQGVDLDNLAVDTGSDVLEMAVYSPTKIVVNATGRPVVLASAEDAGVLAVDTSGIGDPDGLVNVGDIASTGILNDWSYQWIRVDGDTETAVGKSARYRRVEADIGKLIKVQVSFYDASSNLETVISLPFGPLAEPAGPSAPTTTLVGNTGQPGSATAPITGRYSMRFRLGNHGQGYEISSVSVELAAIPPGLRVSLWMGPPPGNDSGTARTWLFDFENPSSFTVGPNEFTAPAGAFAYQRIQYFIVLSDFGSSLSIKETTSDGEDGETGATLADSVGGNSSVLRLAVKGSKRARGILASTYAQDQRFGSQEIVSVGDQNGLEFTVGEADRYLIRGVTFSLDNASTEGGFTNPWDLRLGTTTRVRMVSTRQIPGINEFTAPQGATVAGGTEYEFFQDIKTFNRMGGVPLSRHHCSPSTEVDSPAAAGVIIGDGTGDFDCDQPLMAVFGEPLVAMVQNLGQTHNSYFTVGDTYKVVSQGFTTGSDALGYRLQGIGVAIEGSDDTAGNAQVPSAPTSVSVAVHADSGGKPGAKLFDLVSPTEYAPGHSFFEAPPGTKLTPDTSYVLVWSYLRGTWHRLQRTSSNSEDSDARTGASIADGLNRGTDLTDLIGGTNKLEIAVYTEVNQGAPFVAGGIEVPQSWLHIPEGVDAGYQFRALFVTHRGRLPTSSDIDDYNAWVQEEAAGILVRGVEKADPYTDPVIWKNASEFRAVVCTADDDARTNTGMTGPGVPVHWLDGGWQDRPTLVANSYADFYGPKWVNTDYGAYVTGNSAYLHPSAKVWTGCDASGDPHPSVPMGAISDMNMIAVGTPNDPEANHAPLGAVDSDSGYAYRQFLVVIHGQEQERLLPLYAISPIFTVAGGRAPGSTSLLLVKNTGQTVSSNVNSLVAATPKSAQEFTTGDNAGGYELVSIGVGFASIDTRSSAGAQLSVTLNADDSGDPGRVMCTLIDPTSFSENAVNTFGRDLCATLKAETTYFVVIERVTIDSDSISLSKTNSDNEDSGGTTGSSIENDSSYLSGTTWTADANGDSLLIEVIGTTN